MNVVIRVDASVKIGTGHVMRCLALAEDLKNKGAEVTFICRKLTGHMAEVINQKGFLVRLIPFSEKPDKNADKDIEFLSENWEYDAQFTYQLLKAQKYIDWLIIDHYEIDKKWEQKQRSLAGKIMSIDDLANREHDCDLLLDQNFYLKPEERYSNLVPSKCKCLLGPKFALLRPEFTQDIKIKDCNTIDSVKRIFVFMGGADPTNETVKTINALDKLSYLNFKVDVVVASVNPRADLVWKMCEEREYCAFHKDVKNISELMLKADISIGAGGATTLERCYIGLPSLVTIVANNQKETTMALDEVGALYCMGWHSDITQDDIQRNFHEHLIPEKLTSMCMKTRQVFGQGDYWGINGVVNEILRLA